MSELLVSFPKGINREPAPALSTAAGYVVDAGLGTQPRNETAGGATVCITASAAHTPALYVAPGGAGWLAVKGIVFDVRSEQPAVDLESLWRRFASGERIDWNDFEGTFALSAWDAAGKRGVAVNDQTSQLNFYISEDPGYLYATTSALPLARALGRGLDPAAVREFMVRGALIAPSAMFEGFRRLSIGERVEIDDGAASLKRHWYFPAEQQRWSLDRAADEAASMIKDRIARYASTGGRAIFDLTSGYDSRLLASAAESAGLEPTVTVNGVPGDEEVRIAKKVAAAAGWPMRYFDRRELYTSPIDPRLRRELTCRTDGNLPFTEVYLHRLTRPGLAGEFGMHASGVGGEFIRYHPWGQEFFGVGRRREANVANILEYRMLHDGPPPRDLFEVDWYPRFHHELYERVAAMCRELTGSLTTQQLDAVHAWKQTGHPSLYISAQFNWLPATVPSMGAGFLSVGMVTPWRHRVTSRLTRRVIHRLCPRAAAVETYYGGTAGPVNLSNFHLHARQPVKRLGHLAQKLDRVLLRGTITGRKPPANAVVPKPWITDETRAFLSPDSMLSRNLYAPAGLAHLLSGGETDWRRKEKLLLRVATLEQLCRELDFKPEVGTFQL
jgi:hypothetical protein